MSISLIQEQTKELAQLAAKVNGRIIQPGDAAYDDARAVWNGMIDRQPAGIVQAVNVNDVAAVVNFARENDLLLSVRGGGHQVAGHAVNDGGIVLDLSQMRQVVVDTDAKIAHAAGGALIADIDQATQPYGLAAVMGVMSETGVAGLTLGGGFGHLRNKFGLSCDNLIEVEMVLADGRIVIANAQENSDLFWGIRGGGGNFGVVTRFSYQLHEIGTELYTMAVFHDGRRAEEAVRIFRDYCLNAPDEISVLLAMGIFPPIDHFPAELHGEPFVLILGAYVGDVAEGGQVTAPLRTFQEPLLDFSGVMPYLDLQTFFDEDYPAGELRYYWKSLNITDLSDDAIRILVQHASQQPSILSTTDIWHIGGAVQRVADDATAFHGRHVSFLVNPEANWKNPEEDAMNMRWAQTMLEALRPFSDGSRYLNFAGFQEEGDAMMQDAFADKYQRLAELKAKYDPTNLFSLNQNIKPAQL
ncbi:FAD-binding oxidoreductase [Candidatus Leptofilum sp.]|uniref:FAD-binding oxidoreductase n=1 Tax=Candidatus Leptofilum sp. TaxID=3241576 RepID=UPI003B596CA7